MIKRRMSKPSTSLVLSNYEEEHITGAKGIHTDTPITDLNSIEKSVNFELDNDNSLTLRKPIVKVALPIENGNGYRLDFSTVLFNKKDIFSIYTFLETNSGFYINNVNLRYIRLTDINNIVHLIDLNTYPNFATKFQQIIGNNESDLVSHSIYSFPFHFRTLQGQDSTIIYNFNLNLTKLQEFFNITLYDEDLWDGISAVVVSNRYATVYYDNDLQDYVLEFIKPEVNTLTGEGTATDFNPNLTLDNPTAIRDLYNYGAVSIAGILYYKNSEIVEISNNYLEQSARLSTNNILTAAIFDVQYGVATNDITIASKCNISIYDPNTTVPEHIKNLYTNEDNYIEIKLDYNGTIPSTYNAVYKIPFTFISAHTNLIKLSKDLESLITYLRLHGDTNPSVYISLRIHTVDDYVYLFDENCQYSQLSKYEYLKIESNKIFTELYSTNEETPSVYEKLENLNLDIKFSKNTFIFFRKTTESGTKAISIAQTASETPVPFNAVYTHVVEYPLTELYIEKYNIESIDSTVLVSDVTEKIVNHKYNIVSKLNVLDAHQIILKAFNTYSKNNDGYYCIWEYSKDEGATWETAPEFLNKYYYDVLGLPVVDLTTSKETLDSASQYLKYIPVVPLYAVNNKDDINDRPDVLILNSENIQYKYRFSIYKHTSSTLYKLNTPSDTSVCTLVEDNFTSLVSKISDTYILSNRVQDNNYVYYLKVPKSLVATVNNPIIKFKATSAIRDFNNFDIDYYKSIYLSNEDVVETSTDFFFKIDFKDILTDFVTTHVEQITLYLYNNTSKVTDTDANILFSNLCIRDLVYHTLDSSLGSPVPAEPIINIKEEKAYIKGDHFLTRPVSSYAAYTESETSFYDNVLIPACDSTGKLVAYDIRIIKTSFEDAHSSGVNNMSLKRVYNFENLSYSIRVEAKYPTFTKDNVEYNINSQVLDNVFRFYFVNTPSISAAQYLYTARVYTLEELTNADTTQVHYPIMSYTDKRYNVPVLYFLRRLYITKALYDVLPSDNSATVIFEDIRDGVRTKIGERILSKASEDNTYYIEYEFPVYYTVNSKNTAPKTNMTLVLNIPVAELDLEDGQSLSDINLAEFPVNNCKNVFFKKGDTYTFTFEHSGTLYNNTDVDIKLVPKMLPKVISGLDYRGIQDLTFSVSKTYFSGTLGLQNISTTLNLVNSPSDLYVSSTEISSEIHTIPSKGSLNYSYTYSISFTVNHNNISLLSVFPILIIPLTINTTAGIFTLLGDIISQYSDSTLLNANLTSLSLPELYRYDRDVTYVNEIDEVIHNPNTYVNNITLENTYADVSAAILISQKESYVDYTNNPTELLKITQNNLTSGKTLFYNKRIITYGIPKDNNVYISNTDSYITPYISTLDFPYGSKVTKIILWRSYILIFTEHSIHLAYENADGTFTFKTVNTYTGVSEQDAETVTVMLNSVIFKSDNKIYKLVPNLYGTTDSILNLRCISDAIEPHLLNYNILSSFAFSTEDKYFLFSRVEEMEDGTLTIAFVYDLNKNVWIINHYYKDFTDYVQINTSDVKLVSQYVHYHFNKSFKELLDSNVLDYIKYKDYYDKTVEDLNTWRDKNPLATPSDGTSINFEIDFGQKASNYTVDKQFLETKLLFGSKSEKDFFPIHIDVYTDGLFYESFVNEADSALMKRNFTVVNPHVGTVNTSFIQNNNLSYTSGVIRQMFIKYSGKGKTIAHKIYGQSNSGFKFYSMNCKYRLLPKKQ